MFGKLVKYEMKSMMKIFVLAWGAILVVAFISGCFVNKNVLMDDNFFFTDYIAGGAIEAMTFALYAALAIGIMVLALIFIIQRFNRGLLGSEGYLMFTIPTTPRALITAKGLSAAIIVILSCFVGALSILLFILPTINGSDISVFLKDLAEAIKAYPVVIPACIMILITAIITIINFIYHVYASIALGHLSGKHRILMAVIAFIGLSIAEDIIQTVGLLVLGNIDNLEKWSEGIDFSNSRILVVIAGVAVAEIIGTVIYHIITEFILARRLNLE